jgi:DNA-binding CsgD family transcriptional regulator/PAS domain-containing protein
MTIRIDICPAIRRLYEAATDAGKWPAFLEELARCFGGKGAHIVRVNPRDHVLSFSALYGFDNAIRKLYGRDGEDLDMAFRRFEAHFGQLMPTDPRVRFVEQYPGRPLSCRSAISAAELHASQMYQEILRPADVEYSLVVSAPEDDGSLIMFGVFRNRRSTLFSDHDVEAFGALIPHVKQAVALSERLARVDFAHRVAFEALDSLAMGVLIVDEHARIVHASATARRVIDADDGVALLNGALKLQSRDDDARLRGAIWDAIARARSGATPPAQAVAINRASGKEPYPALVCALWGNHLRCGLGRLDRPLAIVFVSIPEEPQEAPAELLRRLFGLTLAEARLCERLVQGETVEEAAQDLKIAKDTARVHLRNVFDKTGVSRQAELIAKILATPVWLHHRGRSTFPAL